MTIYHIVSFQVPGGATAQDELTAAFFALKKACVRPSDGEPYISAVRGGRQSSKEGHDKGMDAVFILEFENDEDLQYYLWKDPAHNRFKNNLQVDGVVVLDFTDTYPNSSA